MAEASMVLSPVTNDRRALWLLGAIGAALVLMSAVGPFLHQRYGGLAHWAVVALAALGAWWTCRLPLGKSPTSALVITAAAAVAMRIAQLGVEPYLSDDIYRYVWDGRVQAAGINPYRYIPAAPELAPLRDVTIYPLINRADYAPTIYPPVAQMFFFAVTRAGENVLVMRLGLLLCEALTIGATVLMLHRLGLAPTRIAVVAWHPLPVWEIAGSGHIDALMCALMMVSLIVFLGGRPLLAAVTAAAAALVKPTALLALPVFWRPWDWRMVGAVALTVVLCYMPYLGVGAKVLGFLPGYLAEEELTHGDGFRYVAALEFLTGDWPALTRIYGALAAFALAIAALAVGFRKDRSPAASIAALVLLLTLFLVLLTPHYPWYYLALVPFLAVYPTSWTLWLLTVGGLQTYQAVPGEWLPDYLARQTVFHLLVLVAIGRDALQVRRLLAESQQPQDVTS
jgi:hypothetical protein